MWWYPPRYIVCVLRPFNSKVIKRRHPRLLSLAKDVKLGKYTVPTGNQTPGRRVAVHYATASGLLSGSIYISSLQYEER